MARKPKLTDDEKLAFDLIETLQGFAPAKDPKTGKLLEGVYEHVGKSPEPEDDDPTLTEKEKKDRKYLQTEW